MTASRLEMSVAMTATKANFLGAVSGHSTQATITCHPQLPRLFQKYNQNRVVTRILQRCLQNYCCLCGEIWPLKRQVALPQIMPSAVMDHHGCLHFFFLITHRRPLILQEAGPMTGLKMLAFPNNSGATSFLLFHPATQTLTNNRTRTASRKTTCSQSTASQTHQTTHHIVLRLACVSLTLAHHARGSRATGCLYDYLLLNDRRARAPANY